MLVKNWMSKKVITIDVDDSMQHAISMMKENDIRLLPVLKTGKLVGIVTDRDLKRASPSDATTLDVHELLYLISKIRIKDIMNKEPITVPEDFTVEETAEVLMKHRLSGVPVVSNKGQVVGVITQHDLFKVMIALTGFGHRGVQFAFQLEDRPGSIKEVTDVIRGYGGRIVSIMSSQEFAPEGHRRVYVRTYGVNRDRLQELKKELQGKGTMLYFVDHRDNVREIFETSR
jgi:acetoin utilization protein AcuB